MWVLALLCAIPAVGVFLDTVVEFRALRIDARVHEIMASKVQITVEEVRSGLKAYVRGEQTDIRPWETGNEQPRMKLSFSNDRWRWLYLEYDPESRVVRRWIMVAMGSDEADTAPAMQWGTYGRLIVYHSIAAAIACIPIPLWILFGRARQAVLRILFATLTATALLLGGVLTLYCWGRILLFGFF